MWTRLVLYSALGLVLAQLDATWDTWQFWAVVGLFWAAEKHKEQETIELTVMVMHELRDHLQRLLKQLENTDKPQ